MAGLGDGQEAGRTLPSTLISGVTTIAWLMLLVTSFAACSSRPVNSSTGDPLTDYSLTYLVWVTGIPPVCWVVYVYSRTIARLLARGRWGTFWFGLLGRRDMWGMAYRRVLERIMFSDLLAFWITYVVFMSLGGFASYTLVRALGSILAGDIELAAAQTGIGAAELLACGISYKFISLFATQLRENKRILTKMVRMWDKHMLQMHASHKWSLHDRSGEVEEPDIGPEQLEELLSILQGADLDAEVLADRSSERRRTGMETDDED